MKILFVNTNIGYGGASKMMVWVANKCVSAGHDVTFFTYRSQEESQILENSIRHIHVQLEDEFGKDKKIWGTIKFLRNYIKTECFDLAIAFLSPSQFRLLFACKGLDCKLLFSQRGDPYQGIPGIKGKLVRWISDRLFCSADKFVFQTPMAAKYYPKSVQKHSLVIPNPIRPLTRTVSREGNIEKTIVCVARLDVRQKRQDLLIDAFNIISSKYPEYKLNLYGDGFTYDEKILRDKAKGNANIFFMGATKDVAGAIQNAKMFVLPSDYEGIPNALLEAMSIGVPCISTDCSPGGAAMLIRNKENGMLVPRGDAKALVDAMDYIIMHQEEAERMGHKGIEVNKLYSEDIIAKEWLTFIEKM